MLRILFAVFLLLTIPSVSAQQSEEVDVDETGFRFAKMALIAERMYGDARRSNDVVAHRFATTYTRYAIGNLAKIQDQLNPEALEEAENIVGVLERLAMPGENESAAASTASSITARMIQSFIERIYTTGLE